MREQWINTGESPAPSYDGGYGNGNEKSGTTLKSLINSQQWIDAGGNPAVRHEGGTPSNNLIKDVPHRATVFVGPTLKSLLEGRVQLALFFSQMAQIYIFNLD